VVVEQEINPSDSTATTPQPVGEKEKKGLLGDLFKKKSKSSCSN